MTTFNVITYSIKGAIRNLIVKSGEFLWLCLKDRVTLETSDKVIYSVKHNIYIIINIYLATCFGSSEPSSGQFLIYRNDAFGECPHCAVTCRLENILILKFKLKYIGRYAF